MTFNAYSTTGEVEGIQREMDRLLAEIFPLSAPNTFNDARQKTGQTRPANVREGTVAPPIDIIDKENEIVLIAEMPGVAKDGVDITLLENALSIKGAIKNSASAEEGAPCYSERKHCAFSRTIKIPVKVDEGRIKAELKDGLLTVRLPKTEEAQPKKIKVEVAQ